MQQVKIGVIILGRASEIAGTNYVELDLPMGARLRDLIKALGEKTNPTLSDRYFKGHYIFVVYINGIPVDDPDIEIKEGDRITLITPEMGG